MEDSLRSVVVGTMESIVKRANTLSEKFKDATISDDTLYDELTKTCLELTKYISYMEHHARTTQLLFWFSSLKTKAGVQTKQVVEEATDEERAAAMRAVEMAEPVGPGPMPLTMPGVQ
jgi:hypothetical protein